MRRMRNILTVLAACLAGMTAGADTIAVRARAEVAGEVVRLAEVAELTGPAATALGEVTVGQGRATGIELEAIRAALNERNVNWARLSLVGHSRCVLMRPQAVQDQPPAQRGEVEFEPCAAGTVGGEILKLAARMGAVAAEDLRISLSAGDRAVARRPLGTDRYELEPQSRGVPGRWPIVARRFQGEKVVEARHISAVVEQRLEAVVAARGLSRRQAVGAEDVRLAEVWVTEKPAGWLTDVAAAVGRVTVRALREGEVVTAGALAPAVLVGRGEPVTVYCPTGGLLIKLTGTAMEDGAAGAVIRVRNEASREVFWAQVTGPRQAAARTAEATEQGWAAEAQE